MMETRKGYNPFMEGRKERLGMALKIMQKMVPCEKKRILAVLEDNFGIRRSTANEYLNHWIDRRVFITEGSAVKENTSLSLVKDDKENINNI